MIYVCLTCFCKLVNVDDLRVLERCQNFPNSTCSNKMADEVMQNSCISHEVGVSKNDKTNITMHGRGAIDGIVGKPNSMGCSQTEIGGRVEMDVNQVTASAPDSPPFCDTKGSHNDCSDQDIEQVGFILFYFILVLIIHVVKSNFPYLVGQILSVWHLILLNFSFQPFNLGRLENSSLKRTSTGKSNLNERMAQFRSESSASENEGLMRDLKRQKILTNGDGVIQHCTTHHNKLVDSHCDSLKIEKDLGALKPSNAPNGLYPCTSICLFCQSSVISEVI